MYPQPILHFSLLTQQNQWNFPFFIREEIACQLKKFLRKKNICFLNLKRIRDHRSHLTPIRCMYQAYCHYHYCFLIYKTSPFISFSYIFKSDWIKVNCHALNVGSIDRTQTFLVFLILDSPRISTLLIPLEFSLLYTLLHLHSTTLLRLGI